jgi:hypothetical protein
MLVESTSRLATSSSSMWAAVAATCMASSSYAADFSRFPYQVREQIRIPINSRSSLTGGLGTEFIVVVGGEGGTRAASALDRETSEQEHLIAVFRAWEALGSNWDGEGAKVPNITSLRAASAFVCAMGRDNLMPEPMLHDTGRAGLFWQSTSLYADLEFLDSGSIAYYVERGADRHKGVTAFDGRNLPDVFVPLLAA